VAASPLPVVPAPAPPAPGPWSQFFEAPGMLLIRLMSRCNEKCLFCMVAEEIAGSEDVKFEEAARRIRALPPGTHVEFFGGEPTVYPRFLDLLRLARRRGHPCSVASNCRAFHSARFTAAVADLGPAGVYVRTSLYGDTAGLHDYYTAAAGSFDQTIRGIENLVRAGFRTQVNLVILAENVTRLVPMTRLVHRLGVPRIKFGNLVGVGSCAAHAVRLSRVRPHLREALALAEALGLTVTVEKTPICAAAGRIDLISTERGIGHWPRAHDDAGSCGRCLVRPWCDGLDPDYVRLFGYDGIEPLARVSPVVLREAGAGARVEEMMKVYCVAIDGERVDEETAAVLFDLLGRVEAKHGRLAVFPRKYIEA
jgi:molybdenum cofactor biosynthesis enzyme MoaA